jgi:hypothetical protein
LSQSRIAEGNEGFEVTTDVETGGRLGTLFKFEHGGAGRVRKVSQPFVIHDDAYPSL